MADPNQCSLTPPNASYADDETCDSQTQSCPFAGIASVAYLNGTDNTEISSGKHYVNLPREAKWIDKPRIDNIDRMSHNPRIKVRFGAPGQHAFKVKYIPDTNNVAYSATETARTDDYKYQREQKSYTTDSDGTKILPLADFFVTAGKDRFKVEAEDDKSAKVQSGYLELRRLIYFVELKMKGLTAITTTLATLINEYDGHGIDLVALSSVEMEHMPNIGTVDEATFKTKARTAYDGSQGPGKQPYVLAIAYTDHLAVKNPEKSLPTPTSVPVGPGKSVVEIDVEGPGIRPEDTQVQPRELWKNIVPGEGWFVSASYLKDNGVAGVDDIDIPEAKCTAVPEDQSNPDCCYKVSVDVTGLPAGTGIVTVKVNWVDRWRGGLAMAGNGICVCTRAFWKTTPESKQNEAIIHEVGHMVGMVADGTGKKPDKVATFYDDTKGHRGPHCYNGNADNQARYDSASDLSNSICVMYGTLNGKSAFCDKCKVAVRKVDLCDGWTKL